MPARQFPPLATKPKPKELPDAGPSDHLQVTLGESSSSLCREHHFVVSQPTGAADDGGACLAGFLTYWCWVTPVLGGP